MTKILRQDELKSFKDDLQGVKNSLGFCVNLDSVDRSFAESIILANETRLSVIRRELMGEKVDGRMATVGLPLKSDLSEAKPEEKASSEDGKQKELPFDGEEKEPKKKKRGRKPRENKFQEPPKDFGLYSLSSLLVKWGPIPHPNCIEARVWCDEHGVQKKGRGYLLTLGQASQLKKDFEDMNDVSEGEPCTTC